MVASLFSHPVKIIIIIKILSTKSWYIATTKIIHNHISVESSRIASAGKV